ncbi:MAG: NAD/NADP octopine/nopaline dehydrogenase family protein [Lachnospiraceae bacterium]|nr:NAD/NADP octopine/nopaline dehydrogenase family protein [Lachnospiraceae bacterium]
MGKITIIGAGNGGCTYAAYLGLRGHSVCLCETPAFAGNLTDIEAAGGLVMRGALTGFGPVSRCTTDVAEACAWSDYILVVVPAFAHRSLAQWMAPHLRSGKTVILNPGAVLGAAEFLSVLRECGCTEDVTVGETSSNAFACRRYRPNDVNVLGIKEKLYVACIPANRTEKTVEALNAFFPTFTAIPNIFYTSLMNGNAILHPISAVLNAAWIEMTQGDFDFYWGGMTPGVCENIDRVDKERLAVAEAYGFPQVSLNELNHIYYGHPEWATLYDFFSRSKVHGGTPEARAPKTTRHRYITEDVPYGLVPISELGRKAGIPTPHIDAVITLTSTFNGTDYRKEGRSLENLGLEDRDKTGITVFLINGR